MVLGFALIVPDIDKNMLENLTLDYCSKYSDIYSINIIDIAFRIKKRKKNISSTYDGFKIVSDKFKSFCEINNYTGLDFIPLPAEANFYWFKINNILQYDFEAAGVKFLNYNEKCNGWEEIIGAFPVCLRDKNVVKEGFFRTDLCFGSYAGKSPVYMVGETTMKKLKIAGFKEIYFEKILDMYDWQQKK